MGCPKFTYHLSAKPLLRCVYNAADGESRLCFSFKSYHAAGRHCPTGQNGPIRTNGGAWQLHYIHRDYSGSIVSVSNSSGSAVESNSYDAWGRLRNASTLVPFAHNAQPTLTLRRGYTGHEHLPEFGLINMNARMYDPVLGRFLSPDPFVQMPDFSQAFNRYSYCLNNPLIYTDPSGELILAFLRSIVDAIKHKDWSKMDPTKPGTAMNNSWRIWGAFLKNPQEIWQSPQKPLGFIAAHFTNVFKDVYSVEKFDGALVLETSWKKGSFTLGPYIQLSNKHHLYEDYWNPNTRAWESRLGDTFMHEYGHYLQSKRVGPLYLPKYAIPSLFTDNYSKSEQDANYRAYNYFSKIHPSIMPIYHTGFETNTVIDPETGLETLVRTPIVTNWDENEYPRKKNKLKWWEVPFGYSMMFWNF